MVALAVLGSAFVLIPALGFLGLYNFRVTGHPLKLAYAVHEEAYGSSRLFVWEAPRPSHEYRHEVIDQFYHGWGLDAWRRHQTPELFLQAKLDGTLALWAFYLGPVLTVPLLVLPQLLRDRRLRFAWASLAVLFGASLCVYWMLPHYFAPAAPLVWLIIVQGIRHLRAGSRSSSTRKGFAPARKIGAALVGIQCLLLVVVAARHAFAEQESWAARRAALQAQFEASPDQHLVLVEYSPDHDVHAEWVYNRANIDGAKVVWARSMSAEQDRALRDYFAGRRHWRLQADEPLLLEPLSH